MKLALLTSFALPLAASATGESIISKLLRGSSTVNLADITVEGDGIQPGYCGAVLNDDQVNDDDKATEPDDDLYDPDGEWPPLDFCCWK